jgi:hypothetical protein
MQNVRAGISIIAAQFLEAKGRPEHCSSGPLGEEKAALENAEAPMFV